MLAEGNNIVMIIQLKEYFNSFVGHIIIVGHVSILVIAVMNNCHTVMIYVPIICQSYGYYLSEEVHIWETKNQH